MTLEIGLLLFIIGAAVVLFSLEHLPADVIAIGILLVLILTGLLAPGAAFAGFGSDTVILTFGLLVLTAALVRTGVVEMAGRVLLNFAGNAPKRIIAVIMGAAATLSAFISNTATTAFFVPIALGIARRTRLSASKVLMPLAFASILASSVTLVSSSTNIVVSGLMTQYGLAPLGMFELTGVGLPIALMGLVYMYFIGQRLIPQRHNPEEEGEDFGIRPYLAEVVVLPESPLAGKTLAESKLGHDLDLTVLRVVRGKKRYLTPRADLQLAAGDQLLVKGQRDQVLKVKSAVGIAFKTETEPCEVCLTTDDTQLAEAILLPRSPLIGRTLKTLNFRQHYGLQVLGINRRGETIFRKLSQARLQIGDQLLVQGARENIALLDEDNTFHVIGAVEHQSPNRRRAPIAIGCFIAALLLAGFDILPLAAAVLLGAFAVLVTRCITPEEAYREVEWKAIIVMGCMLALGAAMQHTGAAKYLATQIAQWLNFANPAWLLTAFFALTMLLTQPMSNQAAAAVVLPVALETALQMGLNPRTFAVMIAVGASCSFITPLEPACLMVYGPGRYRFTDFVKIGTPLTILVYGIAILIVPWLWPL